MKWALDETLKEAKNKPKNNFKNHRKPSAFFLNLQLFFNNDRKNTPEAVTVMDAPGARSK